MRIGILLLFALSMLASCVVKKELQIVDGSKSDGTLTLAYEIKGHKKAKVNTELAKAQALHHCKQWGYSNVEMFAPMKRCIESNRYNQCIKYQITYKCQCTD